MSLSKLFGRILMFTVASLFCCIFALVVTWIAWQLQITEKAFHCTEGNISGLWCDIDSHRGAGDTILPGWTWEKLKFTRLIYETVFYLIWLGGSAVFFKMIFRQP